MKKGRQTENKKKAERKTGKGKGASSLGRAVPMGIGVGTAVWIVLLIAFSYFISRAGDPEGFIIPSVFVLASVSALAAGFTAGRIFRGSFLASGLLTGAALLLIVWAISLVCAGGGETSPILKILICADFVLFSLIGARLSIPSGKHKKHAHR